VFEHTEITCENFRDRYMAAGWGALEKDKNFLWDDLHEYRKEVNALRSHLETCPHCSKYREKLLQLVGAEISSEVRKRLIDLQGFVSAARNVGITEERAIRLFDELQKPRSQ
jgi:hypothetical protein